MQDFLPIYAYYDPNPNRVSTAPMVQAFGFNLCAKLAQDRPDQAVHNANSVAICALGKPDS